MAVTKGDDVGARLNEGRGHHGGEEREEADQVDDDENHMEEHEASSSLLIQLLWLLPETKRCEIERLQCLNEIAVVVKVTEPHHCDACEEAK